jgi:hypothetical protein
MLCQGRIKSCIGDPIWRSNATPKCNFFIWLAVRYRLWTSGRRARHGLEDQPKPCYTCLQAVSNRQTCNSRSLRWIANWSLGGWQQGRGLDRQIGGALILWSFLRPGCYGSNGTQESSTTSAINAMLDSLCNGSRRSCAFGSWHMPEGVHLHRKSRLRLLCGVRVCGVKLVSLDVCILV